MKIDFQWPHAVIFSVVFAGFVFLVHTGKLHHDVLFAMMTWLAPSPLTKKHAE
jgi:hypothetical protein